MDVRKAIANTGAVLEGDFFVALKKKGNVATKYVNTDFVFPYPVLVESLGVLLIKSWRDEVEAIAAPAVGGIPLVYAAATCVAHNDVRTVWADKQSDGTFAFERMGFKKAIRGRRTLVLEDIASTGDSASAVGKLVEEAGGTVIGYSFIWNRGGVTAAKMGAITLSLISEPIPAWKAGEHEMWGKWPLATDVGHPEYFPDYPGPRTKIRP